MNSFHSSSFDVGNLKDASTSVQDLPSTYRMTSATSSSVTVLNIFGRNNSSGFDQHCNTPEKEDSTSTSAMSSTKSLKVMKFKNKYHLHLDLSDFGDSERTEKSLSTSSKCKSIAESFPHNHGEEVNKSSMNVISRKPRCKTNIFKALKSFEKNNLCTSNKRTENQDLRYVFDDKKYIRRACTDTNLQNLLLEKEKSKTTIDISFKTSRSLEESKTATWINDTTFSNIEKLDFTVPKNVPPIYSSVPSINLGSFEWESNRDIYSSTSITLLDKNLNAQEKFKLKVPKAKTKIQYLCRNCRFLHLREPEIKKPLLVLDFDSLSIPFTLPYEDLSKHKVEISRLIHTMYPHFNIAIWSATNMKILVSRLKYLNVFDEDKVTKIIFCLDSTSTVTAFVPVLGNTIVKPPEIIWNLYPQFNKKNTIMINEDLKKFVFKQYGVPIGSQEDQKLIKYFELVTVSNFLTNLLTTTRPFSSLNIQSWKKPWN